MCFRPLYRSLAIVVEIHIDNEPCKRLCNIYVVYLQSAPQEALCQNVRRVSSRWYCRKFLLELVNAALRGNMLSKVLRRRDKSRKSPLSTELSAQNCAQSWQAAIKFVLEGFSYIDILTTSE
jgi:hypothetical protein